MLDLSQTVGFDWDAGKSRKSTDRRQVSSPEAEQIFLDPRLAIADDIEPRQQEVRYQAMGRTVDGRSLHVTFTLRQNGTRIRVISARDANRKERAIYDKEA